MNSLSVARHAGELAINDDHLPFLITSVLRTTPWRLDELRFGFHDDRIHDYLLGFLQRGEETAPTFGHAIRALGGCYGPIDPDLLYDWLVNVFGHACCDHSIVVARDSRKGVWYG